MGMVVPRQEMHWVMTVQIRDHLPPRRLRSHDNPKRGQQLKSIASSHLPAVQIFALPARSITDEDHDMAYPPIAAADQRRCLTTVVVCGAPPPIYLSLYVEWRRRCAWSARLIASAACVVSSRSRSVSSAMTSNKSTLKQVCGSVTWSARRAWKRSSSRHTSILAPVLAASVTLISWTSVSTECLGDRQNWRSFLEVDDWP